MVKIIYLVPYLIKSGPINVLYGIVKYLDRDRFNPIVVTLSTNKLHYRDNKKWFTDLNIEVVENSYSNWGLQFHITAIAKSIEQRFHGENVVFHAHGYYPTLILSKMKLSYTMATLHNICAQDFKMTKGTLLGGYMSKMYKKALKGMDSCVAVADFMKDYYLKDELVKLSVVYNGVERDEAYDREERASCRRRIGLEPEQKVLLCPAGFSYLKNQLDIIKELKNSKRQDFVVLFAGQGETVAKCKRLVSGDPRFRFLGYQMNLKFYWLISDFMISASRSEGFGLIVAEAYVRGIPCILSNIPAHVELMNRVLGTSDMCFDLNTPNSLRICVEKFLEQQFDTDKIRERACNHYSSEVMSHGYSKIYQKILAD